MLQKIAVIAVWRKQKPTCCEFARIDYQRITRFSKRKTYANLLISSQLLHDTSFLVILHRISEGILPTLPHPTCLLFAEKTIVGYCLRKGLLSGGSPALAKSFYPKCQEDDYKAIIKGKNGENATFKALEPLLDKYIK